MSVLWAILSVVGYALLAILVLLVILLAALTIDTFVASVSDPKTQSKMELYLVWYNTSKKEVLYRPTQLHKIGKDKTKSHAIVYLPGILARENQIGPLMSLFVNYDVFAVKYAGLRYDGENVVDPDTILLLKLLAAEYDGIVLIGASHGGMAAADVIDQLDPAAKTKIPRFIPFDAPASADDFKLMPAYAQPFFLWFRPGKLSNFLFAGAMLLMKQLPKDENIVLPSPENLERLFLPKGMSRAAYVKWVQAEAKKNLAGHKFSMWYSELRDMIERGRRGLPFESIKDVNTVYIECLPLRNDTIVQPRAAAIWVQEGGVHGIPANVTHCGFMENLNEVIRVLQRAFAR